MKIEVKQLEKLVRELEVELPREQVSSEMDKQFASLQKNVTLKGFRKGKAPLTMIRGLYGDEVKAAVADELIKSTFQQAMKDNSLRPASQPTVTDLKFHDDGRLSYRAKLEVLPEVEQVDYDGLEVAEYPVEAKDDEVDEIVQLYRRRYSEVRPLERAIEAPDTVTIDLKKVEDPKLVLQETEFSDQVIDLANEQAMPEFKDALVGLKKGDETDIEITYPEDYSDRRLAGAYIKYHVTVKSVGERILPEFDDALAKRTGDAETALELKMKIRTQLEQRAREDERRRQRQEVILKLCEKNAVDVPEALMDDYLDAAVKDYRENYPEVEEKTVREGYRERAVTSIRWNLLLKRLAEQESIEVSKDDTENWINGFARSNNLTPEQAKQALNRSGRVENVRDHILEEKALDFLMSKARLVSKQKVEE